MLMVCLADVTAFGIYMGLWFPDTPRWIWVLGIVFVIAGLNLCSVRVFGELEFWLSLLKVVAIVAMILAGLGVLVAGVRLGGEGEAAGFANLWAHGGFFPNGLGGMVASFTIVIFAFGGIEVIGLTAGEAGDPQRMIPKAINSVPLRILLFYVLTLLVLMAIWPWSRIGTQGSPFVQIFSGLGIDLGCQPAQPGGDLGRHLRHQQRHLLHRPHALWHGGQRSGSDGLRAALGGRSALDDGVGDDPGAAAGCAAQLPAAP